MFARAIPLLALLLATLMAAPAGAVPAQEVAPANDVRVVIDVSGSMKHNDPYNLRTPALELLVGLLPDGSKAGVWTFGQYVNMQVPLGRVDTQWRERARQGAQGIHSRGLFTDIEAALERATRDWRNPDPATRRSVVLLTDGMVDVSTADGADAVSRERILASVLPRLAGVGASVYAVALSSRADRALLGRLARDTGGWYEQTDDAASLERVFLRLFEQATRPDALPMDDNRFSVDASIHEMTVLIFESDGIPPMRLETPGGDTLSAKQHPDDVQWRSTTSYDLVTIPTPAPGSWRAVTAPDPDNRVLVATDIRLHTDGVPAYLPPGDGAQVVAWLTDGERPMNDQGFLELVRFGVTRLNGDASSAEQVLQLRDPEAGSFSAELGHFAREGVYELRVVADGDTFRREMRRSVAVEWPVDASIRRDRESAALELRVEPRPHRLGTDTFEIKARLATEGAPPLPLAREGDGVWRASLDDAHPGNEVVVEISGADSDGRTFSVELAPLAIPSAAAPEAAVAQDAAEAPEPGPPRPEWRHVWRGVGSVNAALILLAAGVFYWRRRRYLSQFTFITEAS